MLLFPINIPPIDKIVGSNTNVADALRSIWVGDFDMPPDVAKLALLFSLFFFYHLKEMMKLLITHFQNAAACYVFFSAKCLINIMIEHI